MNTRNQKIVASAIAGLMLAAAPMAAMAQSDRQKDKNNMRNLGAGLGGAALYELLQGKGTNALILGAGAAYAGKKYDDQRKAQAKQDQEREREREEYRHNRNDRNDGPRTERTSWNGSRSTSGMSSLNTPQQPIDVLVNNEKVAFNGSQQGAQVIGGHTYVPLRGVLEKLGATVNYDDQSHTITAVKGDKTVRLAPNETATVNGQNVSLDAPAFVSNGQAMVPLRFMAQTFGANVNWDANDHAVRINDSAAA